MDATRDAGTDPSEGTTSYERSAHERLRDDAADSQDLAADRTDWAEDRTVLANERTFAGWMRTGMASLAIGIGMHAVFGATEPTWLAKGAASVFVAIAVAIFYLAARQSSQLMERLNAHAAEPVAKDNLGRIATALIAGAVIVGGVLWML